MTRRKIIVAMSGGVDSSVAAALLKEEGYDVTGIMLKLWGGAAANNESGCCSVDAAEDARRVAQVLDIPFYVQNFSDHFAATVISRFREGYARGRTPNPCVECNRSVKFAALLERARAYGADALATGHYARVESRDGTPRLLRGRDPSKDQSYVLYMLGPRDLEQAMFPVGHFTKTEIREVASTLGLRTANKPESQEICFVPNGDSHAFLASELPQASVPGDVVDVEGRRVGTHRGFGHYTVGQRKGLGVALGHPVYVRRVEPATNTVMVAERVHMSMSSMSLSGVTFTDGSSPQQLHASVMTRYRGPEANAMLVQRNGGYRVDFDEPQPIAAPGQAAVFYRGDEVLGGGTIEEAE